MGPQTCKTSASSSNIISYNSSPPTISTSHSHNIPPVQSNSTLGSLIQKFNNYGANSVPFDISFQQIRQYLIDYLFNTCTYPFIIYGSIAHQFYLQKMDKNTLIESLKKTVECQDIDIKTAYPEEIILDIQKLYAKFCLEHAPKAFVMDIVNAMFIVTTRIRIFTHVMIDITYTSATNMEILLEHCTPLTPVVYVNPELFNIIDFYRYLNKPNIPVLGCMALLQKDTKKWKKTKGLLNMFIENMPANVEIAPNLANTRIELNTHYIWTGMIASALLELMLTGYNSQMFGIIKIDGEKVFWQAPVHTAAFVSYFNNNKNAVLNTMYNFCLPNFTFVKNCNECIYDYWAFGSMSRATINIHNTTSLNIMLPTFVIIEIGSWITGQLCAWNDDVTQYIYSIIRLWQLFDRELQNNATNIQPFILQSSHGHIVYIEGLQAYEHTLMVPRTSKIILITPATESILRQEYGSNFGFTGYLGNPLRHYQIFTDILDQKYNTINKI